ncbi:hypothetical protein [Haloferula sargassicola]|uniref:DUF4190 domain-containing protein n=1 Tax=Haloferula sargassicola TaxID=490096 RepID=A0ABP9URB8_9BACT
MFHRSPTRATPLGCTVILLGLLIPFAATCVLAYGLWKWLGIEASKRPDGLLGMLVGGLGISLLLTAGSIWGGVKILRNTDWKSFDPDDPSSLM